jgi:hypothetical protein
MTLVISATSIRAQELNLKKATCQVFAHPGDLAAICEDQKIYKISKGQKDTKAKGIQNKNEFCNGSKCSKVKLDKDGFILVFQLPNTTEEYVVGKILGDKIYTCRKKDGSDLALNSTFKGDKNQAAIVAVANHFFR